MPILAEDGLVKEGLRAMAATSEGAPCEVGNRWTFSGPKRVQGPQAAREGIWDIALSARAVIVSDGLTPGFAETEAPSTTYSPG